MSKAVTSNLDFGGNARCVNLPTPSSAQDAATKAYVDARTWAACLAASGGASSGANNPVIAAGQYLGFGTAPPTLGISEVIRCDGTLYAYATNVAQLISAVACSIVETVGPSYFSVGSGTALATAVNGIDLDAGTDQPVRVTRGLIRLIERAAAGVTLAAGQLLLWAKDSTPNELYIRDDTNADRKVLTAGAALSDLASATALSVPARSSNTAGARTDNAVAANSGAVFREAGGTIGWGVITSAGIANNAITPALVALTASQQGIVIALGPFSLPAGGTPATQDDVQFYNANLPYGCRIVGVEVMTSTAVAASTLTLWTGAGGTGTQLSSAISTGATGTARNNDTATRTVGIGSSLYGRRSDASVQGSVVLFVMKI